MDTTLKKHLRVDAARLKEALPPVTLAALVVLVAAVIVHVLIVRPGAARLEALREALDRHQLHASGMTLGQPAGRRPAQKLGEFYAFFRSDLRLSDWLARLYEIADRAGVRVPQAEYRLSDASDTPLTRYEIQLPVAGDYGKVRSFAAGVLNAVPIASLDHIAFRRVKTNQGEVEAELRFTLHLATPPR